MGTASQYPVPHHTDGTVYAGGRDRTAEGTKPLEPQSSPVDRCGTPANFCEKFD